MASSRVLPLIVTAACVGVLATGCDTKVSQCNKLIATANKATTELQSMKKDTNGGNAIAQLKTMSNSLDQYAKEVKGLEIKDEQLKGFQGRFIKLYEQTRDASRALVEAVNSKNSEATKTALTQLKAGTSQEAPLVNEVNQYCQAK